MINKPIMDSKQTAIEEHRPLGYLGVISIFMGLLSRATWTESVRVRNNIDSASAITIHQAHTYSSEYIITAITVNSCRNESQKIYYIIYEI